MCATWLKFIGPEIAFDLRSSALQHDNSCSTTENCPFRFKLRSAIHYHPFLIQITSSLLKVPPPSPPALSADSHELFVLLHLHALRLRLLLRLEGEATLSAVQTPALRQQLRQRDLVVFCTMNRDQNKHEICKAPFTHTQTPTDTAHILHYLEHKPPAQLTIVREIVTERSAGRIGTSRVERH